MDRQTLEKLYEFAQLIMELPWSEQRDRLVGDYAAGELTLDELIAELRALGQARAS